ncbi:MAG: S1 RNA-binding domain-containing protein [Candidatus Shikimatogenerans sp. Tmey]
MFNNLILRNIFVKRHTIYNWKIFKKNILLREKLYFIKNLNKNFKILKLYEIYKAIIVNIIKKYVIVYLNNNKCENFISIKEFSKKIKIGDIIDVIVLKIDSINGSIVSYIEALKFKIWKKIFNYYKNQKKILVEIYKKINGGYMVKIKKHLLGFLPKYQIIDYDKCKIKNKIYVVIINLNLKNKNIIVSSKKFYKNIKFKKNIIKYNIFKNKIVLGEIKKIINKNLIIEVNNIKCYLLYRDISWKSNNYLNKIKINKKYKFKVLNINYKKKNIKLGLKQIKNHSWSNLIYKKFKIGNVVKCKIYKITNLFVNVIICNYYIKGIIYINELYWNIKYFNKNENIKKVGDIIKCLIIDINFFSKRIILSYKRLLPNKFKSNKINKKYICNKIYKGIIQGFDIFNNIYLLFNNIECIIYNYNIFFKDIFIKKNICAKKYFKKNNIIYFSLLKINNFTRNFIGIYKSIYYPMYMKLPIYNIGYINFAKIIFKTKKYFHLIFNKIIGIRILLLRKNIKKILKINNNILIKIINYNIDTYILYGEYLKN